MFGGVTLIALLAMLRRRMGRLPYSSFVAVVLIGWFALTRVIAIGAAELGGTRELPRFHDGWLARQVSQDKREPPGRWEEVLTHWDARFYVDIQRRGYPAPNGEPIFHAAFFPLYPLVSRALDAVIQDTFLAAFLVSNVCTLLAAFVMHELARAFGTRRDALAAALLFLAAPGAHFLSMPYTEGLFALLCGLSMYFVAKGRALPATFFGALCTATRSAGVVVCVVMAVAAWQHRKTPLRAAQWLGAAAASTAGLICYAAFCHRQYGDALYFSTVMSQWNRHFSPLGPFRALLGFNIDPDYYAVTIAALVVAGRMALTRKRENLQQIAGAWVLVMLPLSTGIMKGIIRYQTVNLPFVAGAGRWIGRRGLGLIIAVCLILMAYESYRFGAGYGNT
jgi:hypothetical protein